MEKKDTPIPVKNHQVKEEVSQGDKDKLNHVEMEIGRLEATLKMYSAQMGMNPDNYSQLAEEYEETKKKLDGLYEKWDELAEKV